MGFATQQGTFAQSGKLCRFLKSLWREEVDNWQSFLPADLFLAHF